MGGMVVLEVEVVLLLLEVDSASLFRCKAT